jgi:hypothetical protein
MERKSNATESQQVNIPIQIRCSYHKSQDMLLREVCHWAEMDLTERHRSRNHNQLLNQCMLSQMPQLRLLGHPHIPANSLTQIRATLIEQRCIEDVACGPPGHGEVSGIFFELKNNVPCRHHSLTCSLFACKNRTRCLNRSILLRSKNHSYLRNQHT